MIRNFLIKIISLYQKIPGNFHGYCKHIPTCSNYAKDAIKEYGVLKGGFLSIKRILKCNPFNKTVYDPVIKNNKKEIKMKNKFKILLIIFMIFFLSGCNNNLITKSDDNISILTSVYPTNFIVESLYEDASEIKSIYPNNTSFKNYAITNELLNEYSKRDMFVYNRTINTSNKNENDYAAYLINRNKNIKIIDASQGMTYTNSVEETWLDPSNFLMMASNIKKGLKEYITSYDKVKKIDENYETLKISLTKLDAELKLIASSKNTTIIVNNKCFKFLEKYGFKVISIENDANLTDKVINDAKDALANKNTNYIFVIDNEVETDLIKSLKDTYKAQVQSLNSISTYQDGKNYIDAMNENINLLRLEVNE